MQDIRLECPFITEIALPSATLEHAKKTRAEKEENEIFAIVISDSITMLNQVQLWLT
jgi:hypothetical protein